MKFGSQCWALMLLACVAAVAVGCGGAQKSSGDTTTLVVKMEASGGAAGGDAQPMRGTVRIDGPNVAKTVKIEDAKRGVSLDLPPATYTVSNPSANVACTRGTVGLELAKSTTMTLVCSVK